MLLFFFSLLLLFVLLYGFGIVSLSLCVCEKKNQKRLPRSCSSSFLSASSSRCIRISLVSIFGILTSSPVLFISYSSLFFSILCPCFTVEQDCICFVHSVISSSLQYPRFLKKKRFKKKNEGEEEGRSWTTHFCPPLSPSPTSGSNKILMACFFLFSRVDLLI